MSAVFGPFYIVRELVAMGDYRCASCGAASRAGEYWGVHENSRLCGPCCDRTERQMR